MLLKSLALVENDFAISNVRNLLLSRKVARVTSDHFSFNFSAIGARGNSRLNSERNMEIRSRTFGNDPLPIEIMGDQGANVVSI